MRYLIFSDVKKQETADRLAEATQNFFRDETIYLGQTSLKLPRNIFTLEEVFQASNKSPFNNKEIVAYETSLIGHPLNTLDERITQEAKLLQSRYPYCRYSASRATPQKGVYVFNPQRKATGYSFPEVELTPSEICLINPGSLDREQSFAILDTDQNKVRLYTLEESEEINFRKWVIDFFADNLMSYLTGDGIGLLKSYPSAHINALSERNKKGQLDRIIELLSQLNPPKNSPLKQKREYYKQYSYQLAQEFQKFSIPELEFACRVAPENFPLWHPIDYWRYQFDRENLMKEREE